MKKELKQEDDQTQYVVELFDRSKRPNVSAAGALIAELASVIWSAVETQTLAE